MIPFFGHGKRAPCRPALGGPVRTVRRRVSARQQRGFQDDIAGSDFSDAEFVEQAGPVPEGEQVVRGLVFPGRAGVTVDVGEDEVDAVLGEAVEVRPLREDHAQELMVALDAALLPGRAGVAVEDGGAAGSVRGGLYGGGVGELGTVVGEDHGEQHPEQFRPGTGERPEPGEGVEHGLRVVAFAEEREEHRAVPEVQRQQDLAADAPDDGVHLCDGGVRVPFHEGQEVGVRPADAALGVHLVLDGLRPARPERTDPRHVAVLHGEQPARGVPVDRLLAHGEAVGVVRHDVVDGLAVADGAREDGVHVQQFVLRDVRALAALLQQVAVVPVRGAVQVELFAQRAVLLHPAAVADVRRREELRAQLLAEVGALEVTPFAQGAFPRAVRPVGAELDPRAAPARGAAVRDPPDRALEALDAALADLPGDGRVRFPDRPRDAFQRRVPLEHVLDLQTLRVRDVFAHDGPPCCLPPRGIARRGQEDSHAGFSK